MRSLLVPGAWTATIRPLREDCVGNTVFANLEAADKALCAGLRSLESSPERMQSLSGFKWITSIRLNAT